MFAPMLDKHEGEIFGNKIPREGTETSVANHFITFFHLEIRYPERGRKPLSFRTMRTLSPIWK